MYVYICFTKKIAVGSSVPLLFHIFTISKIITLCNTRFAAETL